MSDSRHKMSKLIFTIVAWFTLMCGLSAQETDEAKTKEMIRQWVVTERLLGEELNTWREEKSHVSELLNLYQKELKLLNEELEKTGESVGGVDKRKVELEEKVSAAVSSRKKLRAFLLKLRPRVIALEKQFPKPLKFLVTGQIEQLTQINDETSVRDILQSTVNILEQASAFNAGITQNRESITIGSDTWNAEVIYFGLGRAYFVVGDKAGVGQPGADGWKWERRDAISAQVKKAVEVFNKSTQPQLVELPVQIKP